MKWQGRPQSDNVSMAPATTPDPYDYSPGPLSELPYPQHTPQSKIAQARTNINNVQDKSRKERSTEERNTAANRWNS